MTATAAPLIKFCGLTREGDVAEAVRCGASYLGVIFAGGPRVQAPERALALLRNSAGAKRVGVFGAQQAAEIADVAARAQLDVVQLHADPRAGDVEAIRAVFGGEVWGVLRLRDARIPAHAAALAEAADAIVLDAQVPGQLGGSGVALPWEELAASLAALRSAMPPRTRLVLAGGLSASNVGEAIATLAPDVVDVSSGVESTPGIKDHVRLRDFRDAVHAAQTRTGRHG